LAGRRKLARCQPGAASVAIFPRTSASARSSSGEPGAIRAEPLAGLADLDRTEPLADLVDLDRAEPPAARSVATPIDRGGTAPSDRGEPARPDLDDRALVARIAEGDQAALGQLYDRHAALALGLARRIVRDHGVAEEVVQDAFVAAWRRAATYRPDRGEPRTWLLSIVHHRAIDRVRAAAGGRLVHADEDLASTLAAPEDALEPLWTQLDRAEIVTALATLPREQREAIELAFFGGLSHVEVAERTGQPLGTVKGRIRLGLMRLRSALPDLRPAWPR
jgi:RNA polymerase sigma-70 factor (ECF subfamily)